MRTMLTSLAVLALLLAPAAAQDQADYDEFGIVDDDKSLDEVAPDDGSLAPAMPAPDDAPAVAAGTTPETSAAPSPVAAPNAIPQVEPPADWQAVSFGTLTAALPADFELGEDARDGRMWTRGDMATRKGVLFGFTLANERDMFPEDAQIHVDREVTLDGVPYRWREMTADLGGGAMADLLLLSSITPVDGDNSQLITGMSIGVSFEDNRQMFETAIGTIRIGAAPPPPETQDGTALDGLVTYSVPRDWNVRTGQGGLQIGFWPQVYSGYIGIARGDAVTGYDGMQFDIPEGVEPKAAGVLDQIADSYFKEGTEPQFQFEGAMVAGYHVYHRLLRCAGDDPVMVEFAGARGWVYEEAFQAALAGITLNGDMLVSCPAPAPVAGDAPPEPLAQSTPEELEVLAQPAPVPDAAPQLAAPAAPRATGTPVDVGSVTFLLPDGWTATFESPDDKQFVSPDGRWTLLAFWWLPDEPLLGYTDITSVENLVIDHEPVMRITSVFEGFRAVQTVTERARADGKRFIFTLEGQSASESEIAPLVAELAAKLHLQGGFDPSRKVDPLAAGGPAAPVPAAGDPGWTTYANARFGTTIEYPSGLLAMQQAPDNDDGRTFRSLDEAVTLLVFGQYNIDDLDGPAMMARDRDWGDYSEVTYQTAKSDRYALSGYSVDDRVFYRAARIDDQAGLVHVFEIEYPSTAKAIWDPIVTRMAKSFRAK